MGTAKYWFGASPADEECAQVGASDYHARGRVEANAYVALIYRFLEKEGYTKDKIPESLKIRVTEEPHDFGSYFDVICTFPESGPDAAQCHEIALLIDWSAPSEWDSEARKELGL